MKLFQRQYFLILLFLFIFIGVDSAVAASQEAPSIPITVNRLDDANYPHDVTFHLETDTAVPLTNATLTYNISKFNCLDAAANVPVEVTGNNLEWTWEMVRSGNPPPGTSVTWYWTVTDADGRTHTTPAQTHTFSDDRYNWQTAESDNLKLHWYEGDVGPGLLNASVEAVDLLEDEMGIRLQDEVNIFIYGDTEDMRDAVLYIQDWAGGVAFTEYNVILMGVPPRLADTWGQDVVPHELAHLVVAQYGRSCLGGRRPTWLDEGLAVVAEGDPSPDIVHDLDTALADNSFEPLRSLNGAFSAHGPEAGVAYSQSYSVVDYLLANYGREPMQQLILTLADGSGYDEALEQVYGFNIDGLEQEWRTAVGVPQRDIPATPTPLSAAAIPTLIPQEAAQNVATLPAAAATAVSSAAESEPAAAKPGLCNLALLPFLAIGLIFVQKRSRKQ